MVQEQEYARISTENLEIYVILNIIAAVCGFLKDLLSLLQLTPGLYEFKSDCRWSECSRGRLRECDSEARYVSQPQPVSIAPSAGFSGEDGDLPSQGLNSVPFW